MSDNQKKSPPLATLRAFEAVGRLGGIRRAAIAMGLDHAVVSRHLRSLEDWAGAPLIRRERDSRLLTIEGERFHARITRALDEIAQASAELLSSSNLHQLRIWCMPGFASEWLTARLPQFHAAHPDIDLELRPTDASPDFQRFEADVDIRYVMGPALEPDKTITGGVRRFEFARPAVFPVVSPAALRIFGEVTTPADLLHAPLLHEESAVHWHTWFEVHGVSAPLQLAGSRLWHAHLTINAARRDQGFALANRFLLGDDLASGALIAPLGTACAIGEDALGGYVFAARAERWNATAIGCFRRWLKVAAAAPAPLYTPSRADTGGQASNVRLLPRSLRAGP